MRRDSEQHTDFHRQFDISYVDPKLPEAPFGLALKHYLASALIYGAVLAMFTLSPWFRGLLAGKVFRDYTALSAYYAAYVAYLVICPFVVFLGRPRSLWVSKNVRIVGYLKRLVLWLTRSANRSAGQGWRPTYQEKHALMFLLIKIIYGPLMIANLLASYKTIVLIANGMSKLPSNAPRLYMFDAGYELLFNLVFLLDPAMFAVGYHSESGLLGNKLRYAETNPFHLLVCLACYMPFNTATGAVFGPSSQSYLILWYADLRHPATWVLRGLGVFFLLLLLSSSLSMFTRASNLTNRGIVDWGPYRLIRHPGYLAKNLFWLLTLIPAFVPNKADPRFTWMAHLLLCGTLVWGFLGWGTLYFLRAITEERFLMRDPDYVAYCRKVRYRFIPGVY
jgi:protein-S-isoprenylcysteine O-methyltransferase Ste14